MVLLLVPSIRSRNACRTLFALRDISQILSAILMPPSLSSARDSTQIGLIYRIVSRGRTISNGMLPTLKCNEISENTSAFRSCTK